MKTKIIIILISIIFTTSPIFSQSPYIKETEKIADGHFADKNYSLAVKKYLEILKEDEAKRKWNYRIGLCYIYGSYQNKKAIPYLEKVLNSINLEVTLTAQNTKNSLKTLKKKE